MKLGYFISRYPAVSHTFILREVLSLQSMGFAIEAASINRPDRSVDAMTAEERVESERTFYVKDAGLWAVCAAHSRLALRNPARYVSALLHAFALGGANLKQILFGFFYFAEAGLIARWMERKKLIHLHVHFATPASTVALIVKKLIPMSLSITVHGPDEFYDVTAYRLREKIAEADFLCTIGQYARSQLMKISPPEHWHKFEISPLGVDPDCFSPGPFRAAPEVFEVLCIGRLVSAKGQMILLKAFARLQAEGRRVRLRIAGDGPDRKVLERYANESGLDRHIVFEGAVNQDRVRELYRMADAFVLASFAEGIPVVLMEAMAMEVPCVTTWITGIPELIRNEVDGLLVPPSDEVALASAIARLRDDAELRRTLGSAGRLRVQDCYNLPVNTHRLAGIFQSRLGAMNEVPVAHRAGVGDSLYSRH